jgi:hypothetical protein
MAKPRTVSVGPILGLNEDENPHRLQPGELRSCLNVVRFGSSMVGTRPGAQNLPTGDDYELQLDNGFAVNPPIQGMHEYRKDFDRDRVLVVVADASGHIGVPSPANLWSTSGVRYNDVNGVSITPGVDNIYTSAQHNNTLWFAGGDPVGPDPFFYLADPTDTASSPVAITLPISAGNTVYPQYVFSWRGYLFASGLRDNTSTGNTAPDANPTAVRFCSFAADPTDENNWIVGNTIGFDAARRGIDTHGSNFSTGFAQYQDNAGQWLLMLGNKHIVSAQLDPVHDFRVTDAISPGCVHQRAFVSLGLDTGEAIYMSEFGIHSLRQSQNHGRRDNAFLSWKIRPTFESLRKSRLKFSVGAYDSLNGWVVFAVTTKGNTAHDTLLVLDTKGQEEITAENAIWYVWKLNGVTVNDMKFIRDANDDPTLYIATTDGYILTLSNDVFQDLTNSYETSLRTADASYGSLMLSKTVGDIMITATPQGSHRPILRIVFDYGKRRSAARRIALPTLGGSDAIEDTFAIGVSAIAGEGVVSDTKIYGGGSGRTVGFEITHTGANEAWRIGRLDAQIQVNGEDAGDANAT